MKCDTFVQTTERSSMGKEKDSCLKCGRMEEAHQRNPQIHIYFNNKLWKFRNWEEAREFGFHLY